MFYSYHEEVLNIKFLNISTCSRHIVSIARCFDYWGFNDEAKHNLSIFDLSNQKMVIFFWFLGNLRITILITLHTCQLVRVLQLCYDIQNSSTIRRYLHITWHSYKFNRTLSQRLCVFLLRFGNGTSNNSRLLWKSKF